MSKQSGLLACALAVGLAIAAGCGDFNDDVDPTPVPTITSTPDPNATPTPEGCGGEGGLPGCREYSWTQMEAGNNASGTQLYFSSDTAGNGPAGLSIVLESFQLVASAPDANGVAQVRLVGPPFDEQGRVIMRIKPILDFICLRFDPETSTGVLYCNGSSGIGVDTSTTAPAGVAPPSATVREFDLGDSSPPGSMILRVVQQQARINEGPDANPQTCSILPDCAPGETRNCYEPPFEVAWTTGTAFATKGETDLLVVGSEGLGVTGQPFDCDNWQVEDGPGRLVQGLVDFDPIASNVASGVAVSDSGASAE